MGLHRRVEVKLVKVNCTFRFKMKLSEPKLPYCTMQTFNSIIFCSHGLFYVKQDFWPDFIDKERPHSSCCSQKMSPSIPVKIGMKYFLLTLPKNSEIPNADKLIFNKDTCKGYDS